MVSPLISCLRQNHGNHPYVHSFSNLTSPSSTSSLGAICKTCSNLASCQHLHCHCPNKTHQKLWPAPLWLDYLLAPLLFLHFILYTVTRVISIWSCISPAYDSAVASLCVSRGYHSLNYTFLTLPTSPERSLPLLI